MCIRDRNNNPEVPGLIYKLVPMNDKMRKLSNVRKLWEGVLEVREIRDVFTGREIVPKQYDVDHFIPWSFVTVSYTHLWIQNRANTLALWCMFAQVFPLFQDASRFTTVTSVYGQGGIAAAMGSSMPTIAEPTAQGIISVLSFAVNVFVFAYILKRAKVQKKNPWKNEIFTDTKDYKEAMERA